MCNTAQERAFVRAFTRLMIYKAVHLHEPSPKCTRQQLAQLIEDQTRLKIGRAQIARMFRKYITRPDRPAERFELAIQIVTGRPGIPSEFRLTGVLVLMGSPDGRLASSEDQSAESTATLLLCATSPEGPNYTPSITASSLSNKLRPTMSPHTT
jgi:hypothetical protein